MIDTRDFEKVHDRDRLRTAVGELRAVHALLSQFGDMAAEMPAVELERAAGIGASAALVARRIRQAEARIEQLSSEPPAGVVVLDPDRGSWIEMRHGQPLLPVVSAPRIAGARGVSSGVSRLVAGAASRARVHPDVDVIVVVLFGSAVVTWWDIQQQHNRVVCRRHQHVHIPRGTPYAMTNPGAVPMLAVLAHSGADVAADAELRPELDRDVAGQCQGPKEQESAGMT